jgi:SAM-dependent methyltransferase
VCEFSAAGPLANYLRTASGSFSGSEYFDDVKPGDYRGGIRCEDVQRLTYSDESFDMVTHTEVMEHVPDDTTAFSELHRVLRPGGIMIFTVPLSGLAGTIERARLKNGVVQHMVEPIYHVDPLKGGAGILAYRDYGADIVDRLRSAGFREASIDTPDCTIPWLHLHPVIVARR